MSSDNLKLNWEDKYSVGVTIIDDQHKLLFKTINELIDLLHTNPTEVEIQKILGDIIEYKKKHFATEEGYFKEFNYVEADKHIAEHNMFTAKVEEIENKHKGDTLNLAYELIDYLEDWLIGHLMISDQKYVGCFKSNGLK